MNWNSEPVSENQVITCFANDINDSGVIVGSTFLFDPDAPVGDRMSNGRATIWVDGEVLDLNDLVEGSDLELIGAIAINNKGQIAANARSETGQIAVLLTPPCQSGLKLGHTDGHPGLKGPCLFTLSNRSFY